ncbi:Crp/Fnr family transcriptional regulator [Dictyobacter formicarum]|uniref:Cyclic nucleotide-binding domain-containing protein n=1 Tax=Dictyobacter formicarum TaxID=2778368 RepID=A0ABQ3VQB4_9CHLR|nr:cyclic nucleotide-binding domain-containing protein [Dictyobacter formicarum]GHO88454.1 hypothetical protein KSZ_64600 [Dictyobacter formicarum]
MQTCEQILAAHPFFKGLPLYYLHQIADLATSVAYDSNQYIFHEGEPAEYFYILTEGKVVLETFAADRGSISIETIEAGEVLGWSWLFEPYRWHFSAHVIEKVEAIALHGAPLRRMCETDHVFGYKLVKRVAYIIMQRLQMTRLQLLDVYQTRVEGG